MSDDDTPTGGGGTLTQADVDRIVRERLAREREKFKDYDELKARAAEADKNKSALERVLEKVSSLEERATKAEAAALRADVAQAKGLTPAQAKRLHGATREELEADADELLDMFKPVDSKGGDGGKTGDDGDSASNGGSGQASGGTDSGAGQSGTKTGDGDGGKGGDDGDGRRSLPPSGRPKGKLASGAVPGTTGEKSAADLADEILKSPF